MKRFASVWLPSFQIDRLRREQPRLAPVIEEQPFVLVESSPRGVCITAVNRAAAAGGIHAGQMLADARAIVPGLLTRAAEPVRDARALHRLALWLGRYGPHRNSDGNDGLWVDITGVAHLFGGEQALARDCVTRLQCAGFHALVAIADTRSGAFALARYGRMNGQIAIAQPGDMRTALAGLPVEGLQLSGDLVILLRRLGLKCIGQLYALPRAALARRFRDAAPRTADARRRYRARAKPATSSRTGWAEALVMRLDQALGDLSEPERGIVEPPVYRVQRLYAEPLMSHEGIVAALDDLAIELCTALDEHGEGARVLRFSIYRADGTSADVVVRTSRPAREPRHIQELFQSRLESIDAGLGLDAVVLEAERAERLAQEQVGLVSGISRNAGDPAVLIDRLSNRLGSEAVFYLEASASHVPEQAQRPLAALRHTPEPASWHFPPKGALKPPRPAFLLDPPEPISVIAGVPDGPPARFTWRRVTRRVVCAEGPERIAPEWWRMIGRRNVSAAMRIRDYYRVEDEHGGLYWIYRAGLYPSEPLLSDRRSPEHEDTRADEAEEVAAPPAWYLQGLF